VKINLETNEAVRKIHHVVIPAEAGIQLLISLHVADKTVFRVLSHSVSDNLIAWIPAFAGMTVALWHLK
jgi:hypothetical protein